MIHPRGGLKSMLIIYKKTLIFVHLYNNYVILKKYAREREEFYGEQQFNWGS